MIQHNRHALNLTKLRELGNKVSHRRGTLILKLVKDIDAGRTIKFKHP